MSHARIYSNIQRNGSNPTVVRLIAGKLSCSKVKKHEDVINIGNIVGIYTDTVPLSWVVEDLDSVGFAS